MVAEINLWLVFRQQPYGQEMPFHNGSAPLWPRPWCCSYPSAAERNGVGDAVNLCLTRAKQLSVFTCMPLKYAANTVENEINLWGIFPKLLSLADGLRLQMLNGLWERL